MWRRTPTGGLVASWFKDTGASIMVKFALTLPVLFAVAGGSVDYAMLLRQKALLQSAADAAAKAAALEFTLIDTTRNDITALTQANVITMMRANSTATGDIRVVGRASRDPLGVTVDAFQWFKGPFGILGGDASLISVRSVAQVVGRPNICVLGLDPDADATISLWTRARMEAQNCAVYSNSSSPSGIAVKNNATLTSTMTCSVGGKDGGRTSFSPEPLTDCPTFDDPLASRAPPQIGGCTATGKRIVSTAEALRPGVYCGGLTIIGSAVVKFEPGVYVIKDGPLIVGDTASVTGEQVGFYFTGADARFDFSGGTTISLSAPHDGPLAGLLFFEARTQPTSSNHAIRSDNARMLLGTIYLPRGHLHIDAQRPIADQSAYTAIVVRSLRLDSGPTLVLNTNYHLTSVPVPEGIKGVGQPVALMQ